MATNIGTIELIAKIDTSRYKKDAKEIENTNSDMERSSERTSSRVSSGFSRAAKVGLAAAVATTVALGAALTKAATASWSQVAAVEQATVGLRAYEKDGNKVNQVLEDLIKYARSDLGVLFNRRDLFQSAQMLKLNGVATKDLNKNVQILSRSVGLGLGNWQDLNAVVGRVVASGRLTGIEFDQLTQYGFRLDKSLRNTNLSAEALFKALDKGIPVDAMKGQANTIRGLGIRLETAFRGIGDAILGVDADTSKFVEGGLGDLLVKGLGALPGLLKRVSSGIRTTIDWAKDLFTLLSSGDFRKGMFGDAFTEDSKYIDLLLRLRESFLLVRDTLLLLLRGDFKKGMFAGLLHEDSKYVDFLFNFRDAAKRIFKNVVNYSKDLMKFLKLAFETVRPSLEALGKTITDTLIPSFRRTYDTIMRLWNAINPAFMTVVGVLLVTAIYTLVNAINIVIKVLGWFGHITAITIGWISNLIGWVGTASVEIVRAFKAAFNWMKNNWPLVLGILTGPIGLAIAAIIKNFGKIRSIAGSVVGWFKDIGSAIGNALGNSFKTAVNAILGFLENRINRIVDVMNEAIHLIDNITPGGLARIDRVALPRLAEGGIVTRPTIAEIGEGGEAEAVIPLSKLDNMLNGEGGAREYNIGTININSEVDGERWLRKLTGNQEITSAGLVPTQSYMG